MILTNYDYKIFFATFATALFIVYVFILSRLGRSLDVPNKKLSPKKSFKEMKTGDIVGISYNSLRGKIVKVFTDSCWTHTGIVLVENGEKYIIEVAYYNAKQTGIIRKPLKDWFKYNENRILGWRPYVGENFPKKKFIKKLLRDENRKVIPDTNLVSWMKTLNKRRHNDPNYGKRTEYFCSEYIMHILQDVGVICGYGHNLGYKPAGYKPWELVYGKLPMLGRHKYGTPVLVEVI